MAVVIFRDEDSDARTRYWLDLIVDGKPYDSIEFDSAAERAAAKEDLIEMALSVGGRELPIDPGKLS